MAVDSQHITRVAVDSQHITRVAVDYPTHGCGLSVPHTWLWTLSIPHVAVDSQYLPAETVTCLKTLFITLFSENNDDLAVA